jgi:GTPase SAR1 family protein
MNTSLLLPTDGNDLNSFQVKVRQLDQYFAQDIADISEKNRSTRFRLAVIGEFSQGKSTLLNALVGEEIQPVREIPCSSTITVLKYGERKRLLCRYKDGREEEIAWSDYWNKASLSEAAAIASLSDELANSSIDEIVFEHPNLELCRNGVEILDSPGLNEHPKRTAITRKLLKDADAAIFVTNAFRSFTQSERELLHEVKVLLNRGNQNEPVPNLFVVGNFMDLITTDKGREQVRQRIHALVLQQNSIVSHENRIHLISARAAFNAIWGGNRNEYLLAFTKFSQSIETFLVRERGSLQLKRSVDRINDFAIDTTERLKRANDVYGNKLQISEPKKQEILELIGEVSGRDTKIRLMVSNTKEQAVKNSLASWQKYSSGLRDRLESKSHSWQSSHDATWSQDKLIRDYTECFIKDLSNDIDDWANKEIKSNILKYSLSSLDSKIKRELAALQHRFETIDLPFRVSSMPGIELTTDSFLKGTKEFDWIEGGLTLGSVLAAGLLFVPGGIVLRLILAGLGGFIGGSIRSGMAKDEIKKKALKLGLEKLDESIAIVPIKLREIVESAFDNRVESASSVIKSAISSYANLIEKQEKKHQATTVEIEGYKALIINKINELDSIKETISVFRINS